MNQLAPTALQKVCRFPRPFPPATLPMLEPTPQLGQEQPMHLPHASLQNASPLEPRPMPPPRVSRQNASPPLPPPFAIATHREPQSLSQGVLQWHLLSGSNAAPPHLRRPHCDPSGADTLDEGTSCHVAIALSNSGSGSWPLLRASQLSLAAPGLTTLPAPTALQKAFGSVRPFPPATLPMLQPMTRRRRERLVHLPHASPQNASAPTPPPFALDAHHERQSRMLAGLRLFLAGLHQCLESPSLRISLTARCQKSLHSTPDWAATRRVLTS